MKKAVPENKCFTVHSPTVNPIWLALKKAVRNTPEPMAAIAVGGYIAALLESLELPDTDKNKLSVIESALADDDFEMMIYSLKNFD